MKKFDSKKYDSNLNYVVEASAGTGKTYNIVEIVKNLIDDLKMDLNRILIVTYTDKAAGELKDRIRNMVNSSDVDVDNAPIYTIHSFCKNVIKEFGLSADLPLNLDVIDELEINDFVSRYIREGEIIEDISLIAKCLYDYGNKINIEGIKETLVEGVKKYYLNFLGKEDLNIITLEKKDYESYLKYMSDINNSKTFLDLCDINPEIDYHYNVIFNSFDDNMRNFANFIYYSYKKGFDFNGTEFSLKKFKAATEIEKESFLFFKNIKEILEIKENKILASKYLNDFYLKWQAEKEKNKSQTFDDMIRYVREAILDKNNDLKSKLKEKFDIAIIDEFQDTNRKQFDIFGSIFMNDPSKKIIVVGDPKQSIYSFQGADVNVYLDAVNAISSNNGEKCFLSKNYRSTKEMVESCNKLFSYYNFNGTDFNDSEFLTKEDGSYHEVLYDNKPTKAFWIAQTKQHQGINENDFATIAVQKIIDCCSKDEFGNTKLQIKHRNKEFRNVSFKDFAVLVRTSSEIPPIERALKNAGIPYLRYKDKKLFLGKECADWLCLLNALVTVDYTGYNRKVLKKALFTNFFGASFDIVNSDYFSKDDRSEIILLNKWKKLMYERNWEYLIDNIIIDSKLSNNLKTLKEIQSFSIYKQIGNYCIEFLSKGKKVDELIRNLANLQNNKSDEVDDEDGIIVEKSTNFDCVQIMTMHASKGLQFPVVISVAGFKGPSNIGKAFSYHDLADSKNIKKLTFEKNDFVKDEETAEWKRLFYVGYTRAEFLLIMPYYLKYGTDFKETTTAKEGTKQYQIHLKKLDKNFLRVSLENLMKNHPESYECIIKDEAMTFEVMRLKTKEILGSKDFDSNEKKEQEEVINKLIKNSYKKKIKKHSYSSLSHDQVETKLPVFDDVNKEGEIGEGLAMFDKNAKPVEPNYNELVEPVILPNDYPKGAKLGTALHEVFEGLDFENYSNNLEGRIKNRFSKQGIRAKDEWIEITKILVENVLEANLPIINGSNQIQGHYKLNTIQYENKLDEVEFNFNILDDKLKDYCNGFVDMIFRRGDYYSIVDWKSDKLNEVFDSYSNLTSIKKHVDDSYSIQRVLYSYCLIKWLKLSMPNLTEEEIFNNHFGGVYYVFLRGCNKGTGNGIYAQTWNSWNDLLASYNHIMKIKIGG